MGVVDDKREDKSSDGDLLTANIRKQKRRASARRSIPANAGSVLGNEFCNYSGNKVERKKGDTLSAHLEFQ